MYNRKTVGHIKVLKQALDCGLVSKKVQRVIKFNQIEWLKPYIDMNIKWRTEAENDLKIIFISWIIIQFLERLWKI